MNYASVCSGIESPSVAWREIGWKPKWFSEISKFPSEVLASRHPGIPNLGDMAMIHKTKEFRNDAIDILVGGTPCQSFSVAGLRKGLADPRGNLALIFLQLAGRARPKWLVWENVPGVLSSNEGRDFGSFLGGLAELGYGFAYRVLDAQYFGLAQRRKRVFVVGYLGDWRPPASVLFERSCLSGNPAPSREASKDVASTITASFARSGGKTAGNNPGMINPVITGAITAGYGRQAMGAPEVDAGIYSPASTSGVAHTLRGEGCDASEDGTGRGTPLVPVSISENQRGELRTSDTAAALGQGGGKPGQGGGKPGQGYPAVSLSTGVRRLTPRECERLQGFPDDYTRIPMGKKFATDSPRYKAIGNSMAVSVMSWIGKRIELAQAAT